MALRIVVMGVSGCGKSTVGEGLAQALGLPFVEGDVLHPPRNVALMAAGTPLTDGDRQGWLEAVADRLAQAQEGGLVVSCSALKRCYRDLLRASAPDLLLVYLTGEPGLLASRMHARTGHYMPPMLLQSQLDTLEPPQPDERVLTADIADPPAVLVAQLYNRLRKLA
jgi:gluconokinase